MDYRIVSLCPSNTELIYALGLEQFLVGVDNYSDFPTHVVQDLPRLGPDLHVDVEAVTRLEPHLVVSSLSVPGMEHVVDSVNQAGLNQIVLAPHNLEDIYSDLRNLDRSVPESIQHRDANAVIASLQQRVQRIEDWTKSKVERFGRPKLYWEWWPNPVFSPAADNWLTEISRLAGAENIFADVDGDSVQDDGSRVLESNPDWFLAVWTGVPQHKVPVKKIMERGEPWSDMTALREGQVYILSEGLFCRPSPRLVDGLEQVVGLLYPDAVSQLGLMQPEKYSSIRAANGNWLGKP
ncbi:ABC transporter substrate-binding protein [Alicyclobacillus sp. SO9]|uniref:ABC transporter substrate-binding protein n=1 Tax=Alicyclobacillus sp. SO9 TaxID=2665646 RepID=UPI0018E8598F|nr:ABC transporter substrate-binding protein [Alicyclobacillus sp. SO9]